MTNQEIDCKALIERAQMGDTLAFSGLVRTYHQRIHHYTLRICGNNQIADDAAQETFILAWKNLGKYELRTPFEHWLYRIAHNATISLLRKQREEVDIDDIVSPASSSTPEEHVERQERVLYVQTAIRQLPEMSRSILVMREYQGLSYSEIADSLDIPMGTVMSRLYAARKALEKALRPALEVL